MKNTLILLAIILLFTAGSCKANTTEQPETLNLPYSIFEQVYEGSQVAFVLQDSANGPTSYEFLLTADTATGETRFGMYVITVSLTEGYQQGMAVDWGERINDKTGTGGVWEGESLGGQELMSTSAFGLGMEAENPVAVFVRVLAGDTRDSGISSEKLSGPVAVLQILPDGQGVVRLDQ